MPDTAKITDEAAGLTIPVNHWADARSLIDALIYNHRRYAAVHARQINLRRTDTVDITAIKDIEARLAQIRADHAALLSSFNITCESISKHLEGILS